MPAAGAKNRETKSHRPVADRLVTMTPRTGKVLHVPQDMGAGKGRMATQIDLDSRRKPAQVVTILSRAQERCFRQIHLARHVLHPPCFPRICQQANGCRIAGKRFRREGVHLDEWNRHISPILIGPNQSAVAHSGRVRTSARVQDEAAAPSSV
jgi:hypothetical protein